MKELIECFKEVFWEDDKNWTSWERFTWHQFPFIFGLFLALWNRNTWFGVEDVSKILPWIFLPIAFSLFFFERFNPRMRDFRLKLFPFLFFTFLTQDILNFFI